MIQISLKFIHKYLNTTPHCASVTLLPLTIPLFCLPSLLPAVYLPSPYIVTIPKLLFSDTNPSRNVLVCVCLLFVVCRGYYCNSLLLDGTPDIYDSLIIVLFYLFLFERECVNNRIDEYFPLNRLTSKSITIFFRPYYFSDVLFFRRRC